MRRVSSALAISLVLVTAACTLGDQDVPTGTRTSAAGEHGLWSASEQRARDFVAGSYELTSSDKACSPDVQDRCQTLTSTLTEHGSFTLDPLSLHLDRDVTQPAIGGRDEQVIRTSVRHLPGGPVYLQASFLGDPCWRKTEPIAVDQDEAGFIAGIELVRAVRVDGDLTNGSELPGMAPALAVLALLRIDEETFGFADGVGGDLADLRVPVTVAASDNGSALSVEVNGLAISAALASSSSATPPPAYALMAQGREATFTLYDVGLAAQVAAPPPNMTRSEGDPDNRTCPHPDR